MESLQLNPAELDNPESETKRWIRCLANTAKSENRTDVAEYLRTITPAGTTGEFTPAMKTENQIEDIENFILLIIPGCTVLNLTGHLYGHCVNLQPYSI